MSVWKEESTSVIIFQHPKSVLSLFCFPTIYYFYNLEKDKNVRKRLIRVNFERVKEREERERA